MKKEVLLGGLVLLLLVMAVFVLGGDEKKPPPVNTAAPAASSANTNTKNVRAPVAVGRAGRVVGTLAGSAAGERIAALDPDAIMDEELEMLVMEYSDAAAMQLPERTDLLTTQDLQALSRGGLDPLLNRNPAIDASSGSVIGKSIKNRYTLVGIRGVDGKRLAQFGTDEPRGLRAPLDDSGYWIEEIGADYVIVKDSNGATETFPLPTPGRR